MVLRVTLSVVCLLAVLASFPAAAPRFSDWSEPVNLGPLVNAVSNDTTPAVSKDGSSLYFTSNRAGFGATDIWVSQWNDVTQSWGTPINLGDRINTAAGEAGPALSRDEHWLFFQSTRGGGLGGLDIWASYREHTHDDFGWQSPVNVGPGVNSASDDTDPEYFQNDDIGAPQIIFSSNRTPAVIGFGGFDFYISDLQADGTFGTARLVTELSSPVADPGLMVRFDGLEAIFYSRRLGGLGGSIDIWMATRETVFDPWSAPRHLESPLNTIATDQGPHIAPDRQTLYFASDRAGGSGGLDLYVATRTRGRGSNP